jgi:hypothetical protein
MRGKLGVALGKDQGPLQYSGIAQCGGFLRDSVHVNVPLLVASSGLRVVGRLR